VCHKMQQIPMGRTDCSVPMLHAIANKLEVDAFVTMTDNESYYGNIHPTVALGNYRKQFNRPAKLGVIATTATSFSVADPMDKDQMDFVGFDVSVPEVLAQFVGRKDDVAVEVEDSE
jgi:60 kDa SS-A/Ro ribonucleoprotein